MKNLDNNVVQGFGVAPDAPRCLAKTRRGTPCQAPAVKGKRRCRMHGGTNPGAPKGNRNAYKHGRYTAQAKAERRYYRALLAECAELIW